MSATLFGTRYAGELGGWHNIGTVFGRPMTINEAIEAAKLDYKIFTSAAYFKVDETEYPVDDTVAIYREPTPDDPYIRSFGTASKGYTPIQNTTVGNIITPISEFWPCVTAGALGVGEEIWFLLKMDETSIAGERHKQFILLTNSHKPGKALVFKWVDMRVVCKNTLMMALGESGVSISLRHSQSIEQNTREIANAMNKMRAGGEINIQQLEALAVTMSASDEEEARQLVVLAAYPEPPRPRTLTGEMTPARERMLRAYDLTLERTKKYQLSAYNALDRLYDEFPAIARTPYAMVQCVAEVEDHRRNTAASSRSALFGSGQEAKTRALKAAQSLI